MTLIALTMGEPAGISGEITLKSWLRLRNQRRNFSFFVLCDPQHLKQTAKKLRLKPQITIIDNPKDAAQ